MEVNQYLEMFIEESKEHLQACSEHLLALEKNPDDLAIVGEIFRSAHTLKGMSATMGFEDLADLTHKMENVLDAIRNEKIHVTPEILMWSLNLLTIWKKWLWILRMVEMASVMCQQQSLNLSA